MNMRLLIAVLAGAAVLLATACGGGGTSVQEQALSITVSEFKYDQTSWEIKAGTPTKITIVNKGVLEHDFTVDAGSFKLLVPAARTLSKTLPALQPGVYDVNCTVAGHKEAGMVGKLTVK